MTQLTWAVTQTGAWPTLKIHLPQGEFRGVYIIWRGGTLLSPPVTIKVGQGWVKDRLTSHQSDYDITRYGELYVTWAAVPDAYLLDGIERYLGDVLRPVVAQRFPDSRHVQVNLPWPLAA